MKPMTKWMTFLAAAIFLSACTSDEPAPEVRCERVDVEDEEYCIYEQPITETGYDCPQDLANPIEFEGATVCSRQDEIPEAHRDPVRDELERLGDDGDQGPNNFNNRPDGSPPPDGGTLLSQICTSPENFHGTTVTLPGDALKVQTEAYALQCPYSDAGTGELPDGDTGDRDVDDRQRTCCNPVGGVFIIQCPDWQVVLNPGSDVSGSFLCLGDNCGYTCDPTKPENFDSVTGVFRYDEDGYRSDHYGHGPDGSWFYGPFNGELRVSDYELSK